MSCHKPAWATGALLAAWLALWPVAARAQDLSPPADAAPVEPADLGEPVGIQPSTTPSRFACGLRGAGAAAGGAGGIPVVPLLALLALGARRRGEGRP